MTSMINNFIYSFFSKQNNNIIKNIKVIDHLPSQTSIILTSDYQVFQKYFITEILTNTYYGTNSIINASFNTKNNFVNDQTIDACKNLINYN
jgi:hypothetical protein